MRSSRLDSLFVSKGIQPSDYPALVMDVQGAELLVLKGAGQMLGEFRFVKAEAADFESYIDCAKLEDLRQYLEPWGFREDRSAFVCLTPKRWNVLGRGVGTSGKKPI